MRLNLIICSISIIILGAEASIATNLTEDELGELVVKVTGATRDIRREQLYKLSTILSPRLEQLQLELNYDPEGLKGGLKGLLKDLAPPEEKVDKAALKKQDYDKAFNGIQGIRGKLTSFLQEFNAVCVSNSDWFSKEVQVLTHSCLNNLIDFYNSFQGSLQKEPNQALSKKAVMCGDLWGEGVFWSLSQPMAQKMLSLEY